MDNFWQGLADDVLASLTAYRARIGSLDISMKPDDTLLTEADIEVQNLIVQRIRDLDADAYVIAEEDTSDTSAALRSGQTVSGNVWIVDPIDGTAQFVKPDEVDYCSVVAFYKDGQPSSTLIVVPEFGPGRTPVVIYGSIEDNSVTVNGTPVQIQRPRPLSHTASATRSQGDPPSTIEAALAAKGYGIKSRTTSQTLDMVRTALDLSELSPVAEPFDLFHRRDQKLWDAAAGMCLAEIAGLAIHDEHGGDILPLPSEFLALPEPVLTSSLVGNADLIRELLSC
ncbi:inositol monophosphatase family protein [Nocardia sp. CA-107356]|uniref:inositol monophosphatase family protein n=1 Tax=Nocardia sp. CA-107356 TaxID=3239972 RepID=UPI003D8D6955